MATRETTRPIASLMTHVASDLGYLVQTEFRLAKAEMAETLSSVSNAGVYLATGGVFALGGLIVLLFDIAHWIARAGLAYEWSSADRRSRRAGDRGRLGHGRRIEAERNRVRARAYARAGARRLRRSKGARAMTAQYDRTGEGRLSTSGDYEREAEETRRRLADNLDELTDRLTPGQVFDEVLTYSRAGGGTMYRAFSNAVRENPFPSLLIGAGAMMFLSEKMGLRPGNLHLGGFGNRGKTGRLPDDAGTYRGHGESRLSASAGRMSDAASRMAELASASARSAASSVGSGLGDATEAASRRAMDAAGAVADQMRSTAATLADSATDAARQAAGSVADRALSAMDSARVTAHDLRDQAAGATEQGLRATQRAGVVMRESAASVRDALADKASSVGGAVNEGASRTRRQAAEAVRQTRESAVSFVTEQPLLCAAIGIAVGAALATLLPATETEDRLMGDASDAVKENAGEVGSDALDSAKTVAAKVADRAQSAAKEEGLTPSAVADAARSVGEGMSEGVKGAESSVKASSVQGPTPLTEAPSTKAPPSVKASPSLKEPPSVKAPVTGTGPQEFASDRNSPSTRSRID